MWSTEFSAQVQNIVSYKLLWKKTLYPSQNHHKPLVFSPLFSISIPDGCPSPLAELIHTLNWFRVMLSLNRKLPWRLQFSHFYRQPLRAIGYSLWLSCPSCFLQCVMNITGPQSFRFLLVPPTVLPDSQVPPKRILGGFWFLTPFLFSFPYIKSVLSEITILVTVKICDGDLDKRSSELLWHTLSWDVIIGL